MSEILPRDQIKDDEIGWACNKHCREENGINNLGWKPEGISVWRFIVAGNVSKRILIMVLKFHKRREFLDYLSVTEPL
jgi:hypothetical protein